MIVFLDIDGVLNTDASYKGIRLFDPRTEEVLLRLLLPEKIALFNQITEALQASIVISSNWRFPANTGGLPVIDLLKKAGVSAPIIGDTGQDWDENNPNRHRFSFVGTGGKRYKEIDRYIRNHDLKDYLVIDDDSSVLDFPPEKVLHVWDGLTQEDVERFVSLA